MWSQFTAEAQSAADSKMGRSTGVRSARLTYACEADIVEPDSRRTSLPLLA